MSDTVKTEEQLAIENLNIAQNFNFGHNILRSPASLEQIFSQILETLQPIVEKHKTKISTVNISAYEQGKVSALKANICWHKLQNTFDDASSPLTYFIVMYPGTGATYREFTSDDIFNLLLNGRTTTGWYLLNQIDALYTFISNDESSNQQVEQIFKTVLTAVVQTLLESHYTDYSTDAHYTLKFKQSLTNIEKDVNELLSNIQLKATNDIVATGKISNTISSSAESITYLYGDKNTIVTYAGAQPISTKYISQHNVPQIINSKYLFEHSDAAAFIINNAKQTTPSNLYFYYAVVDFMKASKPFEFIDANYSITSQLIGKFNVEYTDGSSNKLAPTCQAIPLHKTQHNTFFVIMLYINDYLSKTIERITSTDVTLLFNLTGAINDNTEATRLIHEQQHA